MATHTETLRRRRPNTDLKEAPLTDDESSSSCSDSDAQNQTNETEQKIIQTTGAVGGTNDDDTARSKSSLLPWIGLLVWPCMLFLPLVLNHTTTCHYSNVFPRSWYTQYGQNWLNRSVEVGGIWEWGTTAMMNISTKQQQHQPLRHPLGLTLGISAVAIGHVFLLIYFRLHQQQILGKTTPIQRRGAVNYIYSKALANHLAQPGGFLLLGLYLTITWIFDLLPPSYYSFEGGVQYTRVALCLICQDFVQFIMHRVEHVAHPKMYRISHKPHHKFTNPKLFDAFDGSVPDTAIMILLPLFVTAHVVRDCNVWTYMAFGSSYANWLTLIHSEVTFPWEPMFRRFGLGTAADHHVHHKFFKYNFGHLFMWFDWMAGTYRSPSEVWGKEFNVGV